MATQPVFGEAGVTSPLSPATLTPTPQIVVSDKFFNAVLGDAAAGAGQVAAVPCQTSVENWDGVGPRVCSCENRTCLDEQLRRSIAGAQADGVRGNNTAPFIQGIAVLDRLELVIARSDLRLVASQVASGLLLGAVRVLTDVFVVSPGQLDHIRMTTDPGMAATCPRCPAVRTCLRLRSLLLLRSSLL